MGDPLQRGNLGCDFPGSQSTLSTFPCPIQPPPESLRRTYLSFTNSCTDIRNYAWALDPKHADLHAVQIHTLCQSKSPSSGPWSMSNVWLVKSGVEGREPSYCVPLLTPGPRDGLVSPTDLVAHAATPDHAECLRGRGEVRRLLCPGLPGLAAAYYRNHLLCALIASTHQSIPAPQRCLGEALPKLTLTNHLLLPLTNQNRPIGDV